MPEPCSLQSLPFGKREIAGIKNSILISGESLHDVEIAEFSSIMVEVTWTLPGNGPSRKPRKPPCDRRRGLCALSGVLQ